MTAASSSSPVALPLDAWGAFKRAVPTALTLIPICLLLGVLAAQTNWSLLEMLLFSVLGFSGSGQFALLPLAEQGSGVLTMLVVALSINSRYVPIALTTTARLPRQPVQRAFTAHLLGDEAYALEHEHDSFAAVLVTRLTIYLTWVTATVAGALMASLIPHTWFGSGVNLGFPASVVLLVLSFGQIKLRVPQIAAPWRRRLLELALCIAVALLLLATLGKTWFWLPSMAFSVWRLWKAGA
ncbi:MAG: AzlC family ABC transporter permease [Burkholderiaceae bacterium]|jgi:predicted branched-subunit amino acid permease|nr:AzlC family ABC transporter permease [Burkholderiaceae bacterium]